MSLNEAQKRIAEHRDGMLMVDAGPGTGKTHTITQRYVNLLRSGVGPSDMLMVTFTRNSAAEMKERIRKKVIDVAGEIRTSLGDGGNGPSDAGERARLMNEADMLNQSRDQIMTSTFDALCLRIVQGASESVSDFFGFDEMLSRGAMLEQNETLNREHFISFYRDFSLRHGDTYRKNELNLPAIVNEDVSGLYDLIERLMSYGIMPVKGLEWFGNGERMFRGNPKEAFRRLSAANGADMRIIDGDRTYSPDIPPLFCTKKTSIPKDSNQEYELLPGEILQSVAEDNREVFIEYLWNVYYEYLKKSVRDNRLTFALVKIFAFAVLYQSEYVRDQYAISHLMVDEFQDTDEVQMKICLMLLKKDNLCVVGDWKQGIYGFRNANVENILRFPDKVKRFIMELGERVRFRFDPSRYKEEKLSVNYRSTEAILGPAFEAMKARGSKEEEFDYDESRITKLVSFKESEGEEHHQLYSDNTACEFINSVAGREYEDIVDKITEYVYSGRYAIVEKGSTRKPEFGDICVLFRGVKACNNLFKAASDRGVPVFLQGDSEIMSTTAGKLALAWMRFVNDERDRRGLTTILVHEGYSMSEIRAMFDNIGTEGVAKSVPSYLWDERKYLIRKSKRPNEMLTSIFAFHGIGDDDGQADVAQAIINVISSSYSGSLMTFPDIIRMLEEDIQNFSRYSLDPVLGKCAVTIQTMHKSKGLEYPIVIVAGINTRAMPSTRSDSPLFTFDEVFGLRCRKEFATVGGVSGIVDSWKTNVINRSRKKTYDEERRLMFVSMSRAEQYMAVAAGSSPSWFFKDLLGNGECVVTTAYPVLQNDRMDKFGELPEIPKFEIRRRNMAVHDIMSYISGDEDGKGLEYGTMVHENAELMANGKRYNTDLPEMENIRAILDGLKSARLQTELECALPMGDVTLRGVIDLYADLGDHVEIHDYKTDKDQRNLEEYRVQLSVYAYAASEVTKKLVRCFVDFVSLGESVEVEPVSREEISDRVGRVLADEGLSV